MENIEKQKIINNFKIEFNETGDPFVDAGGMALEYISKQLPDKSIMSLIEWAAKIYVEKWGTKLHASFHGSTITHPTTPIGVKIKNTLALYEAIIGEQALSGFCRYCGENRFLVKAGRDLACLVGSGAFVNFHHSHDEGLMICPQCAIKYFFLPFCLLSMGNLALLQTTTIEGKEYWVSKTVKKNLEKIGIGSSEGILKSDFRNPINALFKLATELINEINNKTISEYLTLYHFTNFAASVECKIYSIPNPIFHFLSRVLKNVPKQWHNFTMRYYYIAKATWNEENCQWSYKDKVATEDDYRNCQNEIFNKLIFGKSIFPNLARFYKKQINKQNELDSRLAIYYAREVLEMRSEQVNLIKKIGDKIFNLMRKENDYKKYLVKLEGATRAYQLRDALIYIIKKNCASKNDEAIVRLDEYVSYLFPDGQYWGEVRDMLLIYLYEKMHENKMQIELDDNQQIEEIEENN